MIVVNVERGTVGGVVCEVVDGRELCEKLGVNTRFNDWIPARLKQFNLVKNQHFETSTGNSVKGRPPTEYRLSLVAAKKIAMAEHTDAGNAVRDYFLDRERISYEAPASSADIETRFERERLGGAGNDPLCPAQVERLLAFTTTQVRAHGRVTIRTRRHSIKHPYSTNGKQQPGH